MVVISNPTKTRRESGPLVELVDLKRLCQLSGPPTASLGGVSGEHGGGSKIS